LDHDAVPLDPDFNAYAALDHVGQLQVITVRSDGDLVGYHTSIVRPHLHYKGTLHAQVDLYYLHPEFRRGINGLRLFEAAERAWRERGVIKAMTGTKLHDHLNVGRIFERQGWRATEHSYTKVLKEAHA
jgi:hypothetical protein